MVTQAVFETLLGRLSGVVASLNEDRSGKSRNEENQSKLQNGRT